MYFNLHSNKTQQLFEGLESKRHLMFLVDKSN